MIGKLVFLLELVSVRVSFHGLYVSYNVNLGKGIVLLIICYDFSLATLCL